MPQVVFGVFAFDPATAELRRDGMPIRLAPQLAQVLALLLARPGEIVSREEFRAALWGTDTFVDFDRSLNYCVAQLRSTLGDSSESPLYIKTVPKRGYQFIAPVAPAAATRRRGRKALIWAACIAAAAAIFLLLPHHVQSSPTRIAVARFDSLTGDPDLQRFTDGLTSAVIAEFTAAGDGKLAVVGNATILRQERERRDLLDIHKTLRVSAVVLGEVQRGADGIHVFAQLIGLPEQSHRKAIRIASDKTDPILAQTELARRILTEFAKPLTLAATPK